MEYQSSKSTKNKIDTTINTHYSNRLHLDLLEAAVDKQRRNLLSKKETLCSNDELRAIALMIVANLQEIDNGKHLTRQDARFARLLVITKHIDDLRQK